MSTPAAACGSKRGNAMNLQNVEFIKSAVKPKDFIRDGRPNIVFSGKSNVGKSSVINRILNRKNFARVGAQPGKTVHINYFLVDKTAYFTDLPGYGYAKVAKEERDRWGALMEQFFAFLRRYLEGEEISRPALPEDRSCTLPELELFCRRLDLYFSFAKAFGCPVDTEELYDLREDVAEEINEILLHRLKDNIRFCAICGKALPLHHRGRLCDACFRKKPNRR